MGRGDSPSSVGVGVGEGEGDEAPFSGEDHRARGSPAHGALRQTPCATPAAVFAGGPVCAWQAARALLQLLMQQWEKAGERLGVAELLAKPAADQRIGPAQADKACMKQDAFKGVACPD